MRLFLIPRFAEILVLPARPAVQALRCRALTAGESVSAVRRERKRSVSLQKPPLASFQGCQEFIGLISVGGAAPYATIAAPGLPLYRLRAERLRGLPFRKSRRLLSAFRTNARKDSGHCRWRVNVHRLSLWAERNRKIVIPPPQATA